MTIDNCHTRRSRTREIQDGADGEVTAAAGVAVLGDAAGARGDAAGERACGSAVAFLDLLPLCIVISIIIVVISIIIIIIIITITIVIIIVISILISIIVIIIVTRIPNLMPMVTNQC